MSDDRWRSDGLSVDNVFGHFFMEIDNVALYPFFLFLITLSDRITPPLHIDDGVKHIRSLSLSLSMIEWQDK